LIHFYKRGDMAESVDSSELVKLHSGDQYTKEYEKKKELGRGKFGVVYQVKDKATERTYAAKHIRTRKKEVKETVIKEISLMKKFQNPHIIRFIDAFENPGEVIVIMEYLDGGELFERVADENFHLTESDCCLFMRQICRGVQYLHDHNIVHLDLKPENVVCTQKNDTNVKIIDFGTARELKPSDKVQVLCGTPEFVAPEVVKYDFISPGTDMWSLGVICYILLSGYSPFMGDTDSETYTNISKVEYDFDAEEFDIISENAKAFISALLKEKPGQRMNAKGCLEHAWLMEQDIGNTVIKTDNLRKFLARRRWQRCGQAVRAMKRMSGLMQRSRANSRDSSMGSPAASPTVSPLASPRTARRNSEDFLTHELQPASKSTPGSPRLGTNRTKPAKLNLLEERLKEEFGDSCRIVKKAN